MYYDLNHSINLKPIFIILILTSVSIGTFAQNYDYKLDSIHYDGAKTTVAKAVPIPKPNLFQITHALFGLGIRGMYTYDRGLYHYKYLTDARYRPVGKYEGYPFLDIKFPVFPHKYEYHDVSLTLNIYTPVISFSQTYNHNIFSNNQTGRHKYETQHIDFLGLSRIGIVLDRYVRKKTEPGVLTKIASVAEIILPAWDKRTVRSEEFDEDYEYTGWFYGIIGHGTRKETLKKVSFVVNGHLYENVNIEIYRKNSFRNVGAFFNFLRNKVFYYSQLKWTGAIDVEIMNETYRKILYYVPVPLFSWGNTGGSFSIKDKNGAEICTGEYAGNKNYTYGFLYEPVFYLPKLHGVIIPMVNWTYPTDFYVGFGFQVIL